MSGARRKLVPPLGRNLLPDRGINPGRSPEPDLRGGSGVPPNSESVFCILPIRTCPFGLEALACFDLKTPVRLWLVTSHPAF